MPEKDSRSIGADRVSFFYSDAAAPALSVSSGDTVTVETLDARSGALFRHDPGTMVELPPPPAGRGNPLTGPVVVEGCEPDDVLAVTIVDIRCHTPGWTGAHAHINPASPGVVPRSLARICGIGGDGQVHFSPGITLLPRPMIGCIGIAAPGGRVPSGQPGRHGGNLDHRTVTAGSTIYLPVLVPGAYLYIGDVHAAQGDGELSSAAVEVGATVTVRVDVKRGRPIRWPWLETDDTLAVLTSAPDFTEARREAVDSMIELLQRRLNLQAAEALALLSCGADLRVGQAFGGMDLTVRLELRRTVGGDQRLLDEIWR